MQAFPDLLTWRDPMAMAETCALLRGRHQGAVFAAIAAALETFERTDAGCRRVAAIRSAMRDLSADALHRIIDAPETCFQVTLGRAQGAAGLVDFLERALVAEQSLAGAGDASEGGLWTALGDRYLPAASTSATQVEGLGWLSDPTTAYHAPIKNGAVIDYFSPFAARPLAQNNFRPAFMPPEVYGEADIARANPKIETAFDGLAETGGAPIIFVEAMVRTIMPRPEPVSGLFSGSSNRGHMGRVNLFNPHLEYINAHNVANSLVHEAIHIALYKSEQDARPVEDQDVLYRDFVESPWSGRGIHLLAYIHASFVWFGLYHFWKLPAVAERFKGTVRDHYLDFIPRGFQDNKMINRLQRFERHIRPDLMTQLVRLQDIMACV